MKWNICNDCEEEFRVISESLESIVYCPFCGNEIHHEDEDEDEYDEE